MRTTGNRVARCGLGAVLLAAALPAQAQVEEIVVTAQRREAALQDVPIPVSAFDAGQITARQMDTVKDIGHNVPNLQTYTVTAGAQAIQVHSRGASVQNPGFNLSESPVGIYIDDVYFGRLASANLDLTDLERIEVLRGPQGTLYGRNTIAGAIKVVTRTPGDERWGNASLGIGNYETVKLTASVGGPIEEGSLAGSIAVLYEDRGEGWQPNPVSGRDAGEYENRAARAKLHWYGSENFNALLSAWVVDVDNDGYNGIPQVPFQNDPGLGAAANFLPAPPGSSPAGDFYGNFNQEGVNYGRSEQGGASLNLTWDVAGVSLRSITAFANVEDEFGFDLAGGGFLADVLGPGVPGLLISSDSDLDQLSQEFQVLGTALDEALDWLVGAYYLNEDGSQLYAGDLGTFGGFAEQIESETDSYALFAEGTLALSDALSVTAGLRWTRDEKSYRNDCTGAGGFCFDDSDLAPFTPGDGSVSLEDDWSEVTAKLGADYRLSDDALLYASWAQGYQSGGYRTLCFGNLTSVCGGSAFDPQTVDSFELGYKADLFDRRLRFNANVFYAMYDDIQQIVLPSGGEGTSFPINNIGEVDVYGLELEVNWVPIERLNVFLNLGVQESDFGDVDPASPPGGLNGNAPPTDELPSNPAWQGKVGFNYTVPLANELELFYGLDVFHTEEYFSESRALIEIDAYTRLNGFIGIGADDQRWQAVLSGKNITDEEDYVSGIFAQGFTNIRTAAPPAEYMLTLKLNF